VSSGVLFFSLKGKSNRFCLFWKRSLSSNAWLVYNCFHFIFHIRFFAEFWLQIKLIMWSWYFVPCACFNFLWNWFLSQLSAWGFEQKSILHASPRLAASSQFFLELFCLFWHSFCPFIFWICLNNSVVSKVVHIHLMRRTFNFHILSIFRF